MIRPQWFCCCLSATTFNNWEIFLKKPDCWLLNKPEDPSFPWGPHSASPQEGSPLTRSSVSPIATLLPPCPMAPPPAWRPILWEIVFLFGLPLCSTFRRENHITKPTFSKNEPSALTFLHRCSLRHFHHLTQTPSLSPARLHGLSPTHTTQCPWGFPLPMLFPPP